MHAILAWQAHPIHLWDAMNGDLRATYRGFNDVDEVTAAFSLAFAPDGAKVSVGIQVGVPIRRDTLPLASQQAAPQSCCNLSLETIPICTTFANNPYVQTSHSLCLCPWLQLYAGYSKWILAFDVSRPGRDCRRIPCAVKGPGYSARLPGLQSLLIRVFYTCSHKRSGPAQSRGRVKESGCQV